MIIKHKNGRILLAHSSANKLPHLHHLNSPGVEASCYFFDDKTHYD